MKVGVGYSENPDSTEAGRAAILRAVGKAGRNDPCDLVLMFATARHNFAKLRSAVSEVVGESVPVYGGGAVGGITNGSFGYAGDQVVLACLWLDGVKCDVLVEEGLSGGGEEEAGFRLGRKLAQAGADEHTPLLLFYDAINVTPGGLELVMATYLLAGIERGLGTLPNIVGGGLQGDHVGSPADLWSGSDIGRHLAIALSFSGNIRIDSTIMHGCFPATRYYTVTKADRQTILEINGKPALDFIEDILDGVSRENFPFQLIFGVNSGYKWGEYEEDNYASRLCFAVDEERNGIVMFEPDMVAGTEFQIMYPSLEPDYIKPRVEEMLDCLEDDREAVFALYIDCAGRTAGYGGMDMEDAVVLQDGVAGRVPLMGIYTGVEIAPVKGRPRGLDWTGVFCLFSVHKTKRI